MGIDQSLFWHLKSSQSHLKIWKSVNLWILFTNVYRNKNQFVYVSYVSYFQHAVFLNKICWVCIYVFLFYCIYISHFIVIHFIEFMWYSYVFISYYMVMFFVIRCNFSCIVKNYLLHFCQWSPGISLERLWSFKLFCNWICAGFHWKVDIKKNYCKFSLK